MGAITDATRVWWMLPPDASKEELREAPEHLFDTYGPHAALMQAVAESTSHDPRVREEFLAFMRNGAEGVAGYIRDGQKAGIFRSDLDPVLTAEWLTWMCERGLSQLSRSTGQYEPDRIVTALTDVIWRAVH